VRERLAANQWWRDRQRRRFTPGDLGESHKQNALDSRWTRATRCLTRVVTTSKQNALDSKSFPDDVIVSVDSADEKATKYSCRQTDIELQDIVAGPTDSGELSVEEILLNTATDLLSV